MDRSLPRTRSRQTRATPCRAFSTTSPPTARYSPTTPGPNCRPRPALTLLGCSRLERRQQAIRVLALGCQHLMPRSLPQRRILFPAGQFGPRSVALQELASLAPGRVVALPTGSNQISPLVALVP